MPKNRGIIGISDHGGWAVFVTVTRDGTLLDRRRVELVDDDLPGLPHHHEGQLLPIDAAVALVERVRVSAEKHAALELDAVARAVPHVLGIALRNRQQLPATIAERIKDYRARNVADWVMYREALALAAQARGWPVYWYDAKNVFSSASQALHVEDLKAHFFQMRRTVGPPWNQDHKLAMAAAIVAATALSETPDRENGAQRGLAPIIAGVPSDRDREVRFVSKKPLTSIGRLVPELPVADVERAQQHYRDALGFEIGWLHEREIGAVSRGNAAIFFRKTTPPFEAAIHWVFAEDLDATYNELKSLGANIVEPLEKKPWGLTQFTVEDIDGNRFYFHND